MLTSALRDETLYLRRGDPVLCTHCLERGSASLASRAAQLLTRR